MAEPKGPLSASIPPAYRAPTHLARRFFQVCQSIGHAAIEPFGFEMRHSGVLVVLMREPGIDQARLAAALGRDASTTGQLVDHLVKLGLVERQPSPANRRAHALNLTEAGTILFRDRVAPAMREVQAKIVAALSPAEARTFLDLLSRVIEANEVHARPGAGRRTPRRRAPQPKPDEGESPWLPAAPSSTGAPS